MLRLSTSKNTPPPPSKFVNLFVGINGEWRQRRLFLFIIILTYFFLILDVNAKKWIIQGVSSTPTPFGRQPYTEDGLEKDMITERSSNEITLPPWIPLPTPPPSEEAQRGYSIPIPNNKLQVGSLASQLLSSRFYLRSRKRKRGSIIDCFIIGPSDEVDLNLVHLLPFLPIPVVPVLSTRRSLPDIALAWS